MNLEWLTTSEDETQKGGRRLGACLRGGEVVALDGDLGAGKTVFVRGLAQGLSLGAEIVSSPSFTLMAEYPGRIPLVHIDLFRLGDPVSQEDFEKIGLREYLDPIGVTAIEWASRLAGDASLFTIRVALEELLDDKRRILLTADVSRGRDVLKALGASWAG